MSEQLVEHGTDVITLRRDLEDLRDAATGEVRDVPAKHPAPFAPHEAKIASPTSYAISQPLGREMREAGVVLCKFTSARDRERGANVALFTPAFTARRVDESAQGGRPHRFVVALHPTITKPKEPTS